MPGPSSRLAPGRRRFLQLMGLAGLSSAVGSAMASSAQGRGLAPAAAPPPSGPARADSAHPAPEKPPEISDDARALAAIVQRRYGRHLNSTQLEAVTREIQDRLEGGKHLRDAKLANHDEPDFTFRA